MPSMGWTLSAACPTALPCTGATLAPTEHNQTSMVQRPIPSIQGMPCMPCPAIDKRQPRLMSTRREHPRWSSTLPTTRQLDDGRGDDALVERSDARSSRLVSSRLVVDNAPHHTHTYHLPKQPLLSTASPAAGAAAAQQPPSYHGSQWTLGVLSFCVDLWPAAECRMHACIHTHAVYYYTYSTYRSRLGIMAEEEEEEEASYHPPSQVIATRRQTRTILPC
ncbi:hypothetical protein LY76DRAFT_130838 [Colletotrichum caudatum]|nr:hypothetical protein LY76DRAFT_130838 [Colletotrichum caudatum]